MTNPISIVFASDNNYAAPLAVSIASLLVNANPKASLNIYVLDGGITTENKTRLQNLTRLHAKANIAFLTINDDDFKDYPLFTGVHSIATYYRLKLPSLLAKTDKVIYLDSDIVVTDDIENLWSVAMDDKPVLAIEEPHALNGKRLTQISMQPNSPYFNAGILVLDLKWMRKHNSEKTFIDFIKKHKNYLEYQDQDVMNGCFVNLWQALPPRWNMMSYMYEKARITDFLCYSPLQIQQAYPQKGIVHYNQHPKPWAYGCRDSRKKLYLKFANMTGFPKPNTHPQSAKQVCKVWKHNMELAIRNHAPFLIKPLKCIRRIIT